MSAEGKAPEQTTPELTQKMRERWTRALERDFKPMKESPVPGMSAITLQRDIRYRTNGKQYTIHKGLYFIDPTQEADATPIYTLEFDLDSVLEAAEAGEKETEIQAKAVRMELPGVSKKAYFEELVWWAAVTDAAKAGDKADAAAMLEYMYTPASAVTEEEEADNDVIELPKQKDITLRSYIQPNSKLTNNLAEISTLGERIAVGVNSDKEPVEVNTYITLDYQNKDGVQIDRRISTHDQQVQNAVISLWNAGACVVSLRQIYKAMGGVKLHSTKEKQIEESMDAQRRTMAKMEYGEVLRGKTFIDDDGKQITAENAYIEEPLINATKTVIEGKHGERLTGYIIHTAPALYKHDKACNNQIITVPQRLIQASHGTEGVSLTDANAAIRSYLIMRIKAEKMNPCITYQSIRDEVKKATGKTRDSKREQARIRETTSKLLNVFKTQDFISDWEEYTEGRTKKGVKIKRKAVKRKLASSKKTSKSR